ncbi:hypothetical protein [Haloarcula laminariae]|uniref:hypothetical protein n=1 Tax=Haloarcula laminariae TaxID=2961577 RepID=UPI0021C596BD|nr:hypothetical protein [Halomicroarcula laminariae]
MTLLEKVKAGVNEPRKVVRAVNQQYDTRVRRPDVDRTRVFEADWDNLLLLDACRFDLAADVFEADVAARWSGGSNSEEFLEFNLDGYEADDTVWVTANPHVSKYDDRIFEVVELWDTHWDEELQTVPPEAVVEATLAAAEQYPEKRLVAHFMQPHYPFIGEIGRERLPSHGSFTGNGIRTNGRAHEDIWTLLREGEVSREVVAAAYRENLELVLPHAEELVDVLDGRSVISSDHGNVFGREIGPIPMQLFGHPYGFRLDDLIKVPWVEYPADERRSTEAGEITTASAENTEKREQRLRQLGYLE